MFFLLHKNNCRKIIMCKVSFFVFVQIEVSSTNIFFSLKKVLLSPLVAQITNSFFKLLDFIKQTKTYD